VNGDGLATSSGSARPVCWCPSGRRAAASREPRWSLPTSGKRRAGASDNQFHRELADVNGDGRADIVGFGYAGTLVSLARADGTFADPNHRHRQLRRQPGLVDAGRLCPDHRRRERRRQGRPHRLRLCRHAWSRSAMATAPSRTATLALADFGVQQGWTSDNSFHRTVADVNGDGKDDIIGFGFAGALVALSKGDGTFDTVKLALTNFGKDQGWSSQNSFARQVADVNGDKLADIVGFGIAGTLVAYGRPTAPSPQPASTSRTSAPTRAGPATTPTIANLPTSTMTEPSTSSASVRPACWPASTRATGCRPRRSDKL
jgi:hypothetical protein